ncbi:MAG: FAD-dependent oxidoreductase [Clostridia bacterium]|nr:FAD-dependent oxidoreductase [Clostridia bacterium]
MYDIIIIGGGPAGLVAAVYARRAKKSVLVIEKEVFGGQITFSPKVENIPGFAALSGNEFAEKLVDQVINLGAEFEMDEVIGIKQGDIKTVVTNSGEFEGKSVIIATGAKHRKLGLDREDDFIGEGISFCAVCDGAFYADKTVAVVGGGNSALQEAMLLSEQASKVYVIQNLDFLTGEAALAEQLSAKSNVEIILGSVVTEYLGESEIKGVRIRNESTAETKDIAVDGVFLAIGLIPQNEPFADIVPLDNRGYAKADESCVLSRGIFVAGDCRTKKIRQVTTAAADGAVAALAACDYIENLTK